MSDEPYDDPAEDRPFPLRRIAQVTLVVAAGAALIGVVMHRFAAASSQSDNTPIVSVVAPTREHAAQDVTLPATLQALNSAQIYARASGYVRRWLVDIGDQVRAGQTLALIDTPELDQQLRQAEADYQTALANRALAATTAQRWATMLKRDAVSAQDADEKAGEFRARDAAANAARANVERLKVQRGFGAVRAPFAGIITSRAAQIGALIVAGSTSAQPLFTVADTGQIRAYIHVPQLIAPRVAKGMRVALLLPEYAGRSFPATVSRSAGAVDPQSGSVLVELLAANPDRALKPGAYAQARLALGGDAPDALHVPSRAVIFRGNGLSVGVVDGHGRVHLQPVTIGTDNGKTVVVKTGLKGGEHVIDTPPDGLAEGDVVRVVAAGK
jgi:RND family efflux transporter MFP subunit